MFEDRRDAGAQIGKALEEYIDERPLILGIPRGGVIIAAVAAANIGAEFSLLIARKLPFPQNPEAGFGAIAEDGTTVILQEASSLVTEKEIKRIRSEQTQEIQRRVRTLRGGLPIPSLKGKTIVLTDDGIAMGSTMRAGIGMCRNQGAGRVIVAVPVCSPRVRFIIEELADVTIVLESPYDFRAVAQVYQHWYDVTDEEVIEILLRYR
jgi:predicted phosphoribosyltransferase